MVLEVLRDPFDLMGGATVGPRQCGPGCSIWLDLACCVPALLVMLRRAVDKTYIVRFSIGEALFLALALWAAISTIWSSDRYSALIESSHLVAAAAIFWAMAQLVRSWPRLRFVSAACFGLLLIYIVYGFMYRYYDAADLAQYWKDNRATVMQQHGWHEGDYALKMYEQKVLNGELVGFFASPNTYAAVIVLLGVIVGGAAVQRIVNQDESGLVGALIIPLPAAMWIVWLTQCKAAFVTPILAAGILVAVALFGGALNRKRKAAFFGGVIAFVFAVIAVIGHGLYHHSLPSASLNFRWRYWTAAMRIFVAHPFAGVGYSNFGNAYLAVRQPAAVEEIKDPHDIFLRIMVELGAIGILLLIGWLVRIWWEWTRPVVPALPAPAKEKSDSASSFRPALLLISATALLTIVINVIISIDFTVDDKYATYELIKRVMYLCVMIVGFAVVIITGAKKPSADQRPAPWILYAMLASVGVFLIHNTIDFAWFEVGAMMLFAMIGGAISGVREPSAAGKKKRTPIAMGAFAAMLVAWIVAAIWIAVPVADAEGRAAAGDDAFRQKNYQLAAENYSAAFARAPVRDSDFAIRAAECLQVVPGTDVEARNLLDHAVDADPGNPMGYLTRARYNLDRHAEMQAEIRRDYEQALAMNPIDLETRQEYAAVLEKFGDRAAAVEQYQKVLKVNEGYDAEEPRRLTEDRVKEIEGKVGEQK
jgi:O-antigen ligase